MQQTWTNRRVTVLGLSKSGSAVARYVQKRGGQCFLSETLPATPTNEPLRRELEALGVEIEMGGHSKKCFTHSDLVIVSPGIPPSSHIMNELRMSGKEIISEVELAYRETQVPILAITGTNGKTTTTTLISNILTLAGHCAPACGNIGRPLIEVLDEEGDKLDYLVAELSSFQLEFSPTFKAQVAIFTNFKPDHLDWHGSVEAYQRAKLKLFSGAQSPDWSIVLADDPVCSKVEALTSGRVLWFSQTEAFVHGFEDKIYLDDTQHLVLARAHQPAQRMFSAKDLKLIGRHNYENVMAAVAATALVGVPPEIITQACLAFSGVEHRLEPVTTVQGTTFYNDSKATNPDATLSALRSFEDTRVILIAGGRDKHGPLDDFVETVKTHARAVVLMGEASQRFAEALQAGGFQEIYFAETFDMAISTGFQCANGEPVLFSPACASFDMFKNFEERGNVFKTLVLGLKAAVEKNSGASNPALTP